MITTFITTQIIKWVEYELVTEDLDEETTISLAYDFNFHCWTMFAEDSFIGGDSTGAKNRQHIHVFTNWAVA